jgi:hypothetical protein
MKKLTTEQKEDLVSGVDAEGFDYYFLHYTDATKEFADTEIVPLVNEYVKVARALHAKIDEYAREIDEEYERQAEESEGDDDELEE